MCLDERVTCIDVSCYENYSGLQSRHVEPSRGDHLIYVELSKSSERQRPHHDAKSNHAMHKNDLTGVPSPVVLRRPPNPPECPWVYGQRAR